MNLLRVQSTSKADLCCKPGVKWPIETGLKGGKTSNPPPKSITKPTTSKATSPLPAALLCQDSPTTQGEVTNDRIAKLADAINGIKKSLDSFAGLLVIEMEDHLPDSSSVEDRPSLLEHNTKTLAIALVKCTRSISLLI